MNWIGTTTPACVPFETWVASQNGSFALTQSFSVPMNRLGLRPRSSQTVLYELEADEEPYDAPIDAERYLEVVFISNGTGGDFGSDTENNNPSGTGGDTKNNNPGGTEEGGGRMRRFSCRTASSVGVFAAR